MSRTDWLIVGEIALGFLLVLGGLFLRKFVEHTARGLVDERLETMKANFAEVLEERKAELNRYAEYVRHGMARDLLQAELRARSLHRIYPRLAKKWHLAAAGIDDLFRLRVYLSPPTATRDQFAKYVSTQQFSAERETRIISEFERDREAAVSLVIDELRKRQVASACQYLDDACTFLLLNRLYCSDDVITAVQKLEDLLRELFDDSQGGHVFGHGPNPEALPEIDSKRTEVGERLKSLDALLRLELAPRQLPHAPP
jgi:hypothetical protein